MRVTSNKERFDNFVAHSPAFFDDLDADNLDKKHQRIVAQAYAQFEAATGRVGANYRSWGEQSDLTVPAQLSSAYLKAQGFGLGIAKWGYRSLFRRAQDRNLRHVLEDDVALIDELGGGSLIDENPAHLSPGAREFYFLKGRSVSMRFLRYVYLLKRMEIEALLPESGVWVDVGSYYGGLQGLVRKYHPKTSIVMVDFHHQLARAYIYLSQLFEDATHVFPDQVDAGIDLRSLPEGSITYVPAKNFDAIADQKVDLASNFFSFGEMRRPICNGYMDSDIFRKASRTYLANRFVSAPWIEPTYDTDVTVLDYQRQERKVLYFDTLPLHFFLQIKREVLGTSRMRNLSSPYFEMITAPAEM
ncbi:MAG: putative sugar O-methyltransferase [Dinoroseobacter sp.]|nr:putative sugar O-methyltransferase [Dinoroseobacter sp.]